LTLSFAGLLFATGFYFWGPGFAYEGKVIWVDAIALPDLELGGLTDADNQGEILFMKTAKALALTVILAVLPSRLLADGTVSPPNPLGEKLYYEFLRAHFYSQLLPFLLLGFVLLVIFVSWVFQYRAARLADGDCGS
jgi:hypothetical protein